MFTGPFYGWRKPNDDPMLGYLRLRSISDSAYTIKPQDLGWTLEFSSNATVTVTLPMARTCRGRWVRILKKYTGGSTKIIFTSIATPADTIDGTAIGTTVVSRHGSLILWSDGTEWRVLEGCSWTHPLLVQSDGSNQLDFYGWVTNATANNLAGICFRSGLAVTKSFFYGEKSNGTAFNNASLVNGDFWVHNTSTTWACYVKGQTQFVRTTINVERVDSGPDASTAEVSLLDAAPTLPANWFKAGHAIVIELYGTHDNAGAQYRFSVKLGSTRLADVTWSVSSTGNWHARIVLACTSAGASGNIRCSVEGGYNLNATSMFCPAVSDTTINTTASKVLDVTMRDNLAATAITVTKKLGFIDALTST